MCPTACNVPHVVLAASRLVPPGKRSQQQQTCPAEDAALCLLLRQITLPKPTCLSINHNAGQGPDCTFRTPRVHSLLPHKPPASVWALCRQFGCLLLPMPHRYGCPPSPSANIHHNFGAQPATTQVSSRCTALCWCLRCLLQPQAPQNGAAPYPTPCKERPHLRFTAASNTCLQKVRSPLPTVQVSMQQTSQQQRMKGGLAAVT